MLLKGNTADFQCRIEELPHLEETLLEILVMPTNDAKLIRLRTTHGILHFLSNHFTGWVIHDPKPQDETP